MPNKTYALEWIELAKKNLDTADFLYKNKHYTDIIAVELQQALEKMMKACYAFHNKKIPRIHEVVSRPSEIFVIFEYKRLKPFT